MSVGLAVDVFLEFPSHLNLSGEDIFILWDSSHINLWIPNLNLMFFFSFVLIAPVSTFIPGSIVLNLAAFLFVRWYISISNIGILIFWGPNSPTTMLCTWWHFKYLLNSVYKINCNNHFYHTLEGSIFNFKLKTLYDVDT